MHWVLAIIGVFIGLLLSEISNSFAFGLASVIGLGLLGLLSAEVLQLRQRLARLEQGTRAVARAETVPSPQAMPEVERASSANGPEAAATMPPPLPSRVSALSQPRPLPRSEVPASMAGAAAASVPVAESASSESSTPLPRTLPERLLERFRQWFLSGNVPAKIGVLVLLFGVAAALKYSVDAGWLRAPVSLRLALIAASGLGVMLWGWRNRSTRPAFGLSLQGGGIGILLLTVFAAYRLYQLLPASAAFALVLILVAGAAVLAVLQDAVALAVLGFLGGYLAPLLLSTGSGNHVALFSFYAVLNLAVFGIAWRRHWRGLDLIGFFFTFGVAWLWGAKYYRPELYASVQPFLIAFFLFYVVIALLHTWRAPSAQRAMWLETVLVFGTPLLAFPMQAALLRGNSLALAWSALLLGVLYAALAYVVLRKRGALLLGQSFAALALGFATLAIPLAFSTRWTCAAWAMEGAALVWVGLRQQRLLPRLGGLALQGLAALAYGYSLLRGGWQAQAGEWLLLNGHALCVLCLSLAAFFTAWVLERHGCGRFWVWPPFIVAALWWFVAGWRELDQHPQALARGFGVEWLHERETWLLLALFTLLVMSLARRLTRWPRLGWLSVLSVLAGLWLALDMPSALQGVGKVLWPLWFGVALMALALLRQPEQRGLSFAHVALLFCFALVCGRTLDSLETPLAWDWRYVLGFLPLIILFWLTWRWPAVGAFPLADRFPRYAGRWFWPAGVILGLAWLASLGLPGEVAPLPFLPVLNPVELLQWMGLMAAGRGLQRRFGSRAYLVIAVAGFFALSAAGLRWVHHFSDLPWTLALLDHGQTQAMLSVLWALAGVGAWVIGSRRQNWMLWLVGAILMGLVLAKLVLVDRLYAGNLAGIVSFIAVGGLLVLVGRIAPTPPRHEIAGKIS